MNKTTEALKLATVALKDIACTSQTEDLLWWQIRAREALAAIREALAEPVKQEPVAFEEWWKETGQETLYALNTLTDADAKILAKIAWESAQEKPVKQEPVGVVEPSEEWGVAGVLIAGLPIGTKLYAAPVQPVKQEPVAFALSHSLGLEFSSNYPMCESKERAEEFARQHMGQVVVTPLYAAPVDAKAIRAEALEEAAKMCDGWDFNVQSLSKAIRGLK